MESVATQCGKEYDELGVPTKVSMPGQWERISECPLEKNSWRQIARSYQKVSKESATVALFGKWVFSSVIYLTITTLGHHESMKISKSRSNIHRREHRKESWRSKPHKAWSLRNRQWEGALVWVLSLQTSVPHTGRRCKYTVLCRLISGDLL